VRLGRIGFWYRLAIVILKPVLLVFTRRRWSGFEHVPAEGGVIIAVNHISHADPFVFADAVLFSTRRAPRFLAKSTLFTGKGPLRGFVARVMRGARQIPVARYTTDASLALAAAVEALQQGEAVGIYPEGTVTRDPGKWPMQAKTGVARLALLSGAPVVPVAQWGAQEILDSYRTPGLHLLPRHTMTVVAGPPVDLTPWQGKELTSEVLHEATEAVMTAITRQLEQIRGESAPRETFRFEPARRTA
jgi:1-acyl-sn-glycerol-3-phosphate acyltransferase